jgi:uncharacterized membrane protein (UPF0127 family)
LDGNGRGPPRVVTLKTQRATLHVALADTPQRRADGLASRDSVVGDGLLLVWLTSGRHPIWIAQMRFPVDVAWLDRDGRVLVVLLKPARSLGCSDCNVQLPENIAGEAEFIMVEFKDRSTFQR